jgi:hypothetical protein
MNSNSTFKHTLVVLAAIGLSFPSWGQDTVKKDSLSSETVVIIREFEPVIKDAKKINHQPV